MMFVRRTPSSAEFWPSHAALRNDNAALLVLRRCGAIPPYSLWGCGRSGGHPCGSRRATAMAIVVGLLGESLWG